MLKKSSRNQVIFERFYDKEPNPSTELVYHSPFELLVAVILSAQATDKAVNKSTKPLFSAANTPQNILKLGKEKLEYFVQSINYYPTKVRNILRVCALLIEKHNAQVPNNRQDLEALPGVGRKTANVILNVIFGCSAIAVDTHIFRVGNRTGLACGKTPILVEKKLMKAIPKKYQRDAHHWLVLHGRYTCKAKKPLCGTCLIQDLCDKRFL